MSRTTSLLLIVFAAVLVVGVLSAAAVAAVGAFVITESTTTVVTPIVVAELPTLGSTAVVTNTPAITVTATSVATENANQPATAVPATVVPATAVTVHTTSVKYVMALGDVNMRSGPGMAYNVIGWVAGGQIAAVTGVSSDNGWWRVQCADGTTGSCWVTANADYTQPTTAPTTPPTAVPACTDAAAFVADVTIPDGSTVAAGTSFVKTWRIKNSGSCTWDGRYQLIFAGGNTLGAAANQFPLPATVAPGGQIDLSVQLVAPTTPMNYQSDWKLQNPQGQIFGIGANGSTPFWVKIVVPGQDDAAISGVVYQDANANGRYDQGETLMGNHIVWLIASTACHVAQNPTVVAFTGSDGIYTFKGAYNGHYCLALPGVNGLDDVLPLAVAPGQVFTDINLKSPVPNGSISGYLWNDLCLVQESGAVLNGNCVSDGQGGYHADGMIQPTEPYISGVAIRLQWGACANNTAVSVTAVTDASGRYDFGNLQPGVYCISMNAAADGNAAKLLPGDWTFPARGQWYQEVMLRAGDQVAPVNFGWDYQLN